MPPINDIDTPVDEALLRGDDVVDEAVKEDELKDEVIDDNEVVEDEQQVEVTAKTEEVEEVEVTQDKEHKDKQGFVTQERFNQVYARAKQLEEQLEAANKPVEKVEEVKTVDIKQLRLEAKEAFLDGEDDKYNEIMDKIDAEVLRRAEQAAESRFTQRQESTSFQQKAVELATKYPVLNDEGGNPEAIQMVIDLRDSYIAKGMGATQALEAAANKIAPLFTPKQEVAQGDKKADLRVVKAVERGIKDGEKVPAQDLGVGNRAQTLLESRDLTQEEWDGLSDKERQARLSA